MSLLREILIHLGVAVAVLVALSGILFAGFWIFDYVQHKLRIKKYATKYPTCACVLSPAEMTYLETAERKFDIIEQDVTKSAPKWYDWVSGIVLVLILIMSWCFVWTCILLFYILAGFKLNETSTDWLIGVIPLFMGLGIGIFLSGWIICEILQRQTRLGLYNALKSKVQHIDTLLHQIRKNPRFIDDSFDAQKFFLGQNQRHLKIYRNWFLILTLITVIVMCVEVFLVRGGHLL